MLVCLGGFLGSGRRALAHALSEKFGLYYYGIEAKKPRRFVIEEAHTVKEVIVPIMADALRVDVYRRAIEDFPLIAKLHTNVIVNDSFNRKAPREYFFAEARKHFKPVVFVWVTSPDTDVPRRFERMKELRLLGSIREGLVIRRREQRYFEPFNEAPYTFENADGGNTADELWETISALTRTT